jgi:hypothetical protein
LALGSNRLFQSTTRVASAGDTAFASGMRAFLNVAASQVAHGHQPATTCPARPGQRVCMSGLCHPVHPVRACLGSSRQATETICDPRSVTHSERPSLFHLGRAARAERVVAARNPRFGDDARRFLRCRPCRPSQSREQSRMGHHPWTRTHSVARCTTTAPSRSRASR